MTNIGDRNRTKIKARDYIVGHGFPVENGAVLAKALMSLNLTPGFDLEIDLCHLSSQLLISSFFRSFFQTLYEGGKEYYQRIQDFKWVTDFEFQEESIRRWAEKFVSEKGLGVDENTRKKLQLLRDFQARLKHMEEKAKVRVYQEGTDEEFGEFIADLAGCMDNDKSLQMVERMREEGIL